MKHPLNHVKLNLTIMLLAAVIGVAWASWMYIPEVAGDWARAATLLILPYLIAAIIVRISVNHVMGLFDTNVSIEHRLLLRKAYTGFIYMFATLVALYELGVAAQNITILVGLITTALALAMKDIITSYLTWYILLTKRPFKIGEYIKIGDEQGIVEHIGTFHVLLNDSPERNKEFIRVPNKVFLEKPIYNFGRSVPIILRIPIKAKSYDQKHARIQAQIKERTGTTPQMWLDADNLGICLRVECQTTFTERTKIKDTILGVVQQEMGD
ncbi:mechanosensitive ion channel [Candidatus Woesearchaeota archaeon]|nr:mechanosensitive ion channel [Candidatus Woesearchaeota archaeon]